jgi:hypothetical protein
MRLYTTIRPDAIPLEGCITFRDEDLGFKALILPAKEAPHVGADSPRFMEPGRPAVVFGIPTLFDDEGRDVTNTFWYYLGQIKSLILTRWAVELAGKKEAVTA